MSPNSVRSVHVEHDPTNETLHTLTFNVDNDGRSDLPQLSVAVIFAVAVAISATTTAIAATATAEVSLAASFS
jgi:hypothetical protein